MWIKVQDIGDGDLLINLDALTHISRPLLKAFMLSGESASLSVESYNELEKTLFPKRKAYSKDDTELAEFLDKLHKLTGGKNEAILTPQRNKKLKFLIDLKSMGREKLIAAATNIGKDEWLQGKNDNNKRYGDIDYLLRPDKAAKWAEVNPEDKKRKMF